MDEEFRRLLRDPDISENVKVSLLPELLKFSNQSQKPSASSLSKILQSGPVIAALASIFTIGITEISKGNLVSVEKQHERSLEELKFQFDVIKLALDESKSSEDRASSLKFFTEIKLLDGLNSEALASWSESGNVPSIPDNNKRIFPKKQRLYKEAISIVRQLLDDNIAINPESELNKRYWELYQKDLIGVESSEVANAMILFGRQLKLFERGYFENKSELSKTGKNVVSHMREELESHSASVRAEVIQ